MRSRSEIIEVFSTFVQFEADCFQAWVADGRLRRSIQQCLNRTVDAPHAESFWGAYWYKIWHTQALPLAARHLTAYLQEPCYWAAQQIYKKFQNLHYRLPDYFQLAIADIQTVLKDFNPDKGASLKTYAALAFPSLLRDILRQRQEADFCSSWTLLRKVSKKRLNESLYYAGLTDAAVARYRLAWFCFKALYVPTAGEKLPKPDQNLWEAIAQLYNSERQSHLTSPGTECAPETLERWLTQCATWIRAYLYPAIDSLNVAKAGQETGEIQDHLPDFSESLLQELVRQEEMQQRQAQQSQIRDVLATAIEQLDRSAQEVLRLHYRQGFTQQQIVQHLQLSQATVSRRLSKARESLLAALVQWSQQEINQPNLNPPNLNPPNLNLPNLNPPETNISVTPARIKQISAGLEEWLQVHYQNSDLAAGTS